MLIRNTTTSAFNESLLPRDNLPGDARVNDRMYPAVFVQRDSPLNSNSTLSGMRFGNKPQFSATKVSGEMSLRVPKQSHLVLFRPALDIISFEDMSKGGIKRALKPFTYLNLELGNIQSLAIPYTYSGTMFARQVLQDSGEEMSFSKRLKELISVAKKWIPSQPSLSAI
jgi:hypothetical protein